MSFLSIKGIRYLFLLIIVMPQVGGCGLSVPYEPIYIYEEYDEFVPDDTPEVPLEDELPVGFGLDEDILDESFVSSYFHIYYIYAQDGQFLGYVNDKFYDSTSLCDVFGPYGSDYSDTSIFYIYNRYGSDYSEYSAFDDFANFPPILYEDGYAVAFVSTNWFFLPRVDPYYLMDLLNSFSCGVSRW